MSKTKKRNTSFLKGCRSGRDPAFQVLLKIMSAYNTAKENLVEVTAIPAQESNCHRV